MAQKSWATAENSSWWLCPVPPPLWPSLVPLAGTSLPPTDHGSLRGPSLLPYISCFSPHCMRIRRITLPHLLPQIHLLSFIHACCFTTRSPHIMLPPCSPHPRPLPHAHTSSSPSRWSQSDFQLLCQKQSSPTSSCPQPAHKFLLCARNSVLEPVKIFIYLAVLGMCLFTSILLPWMLRMRTVAHSQVGSQ